MCLDIRPEVACRVTACEAVGVFIVGQEQHLDVHAFCQQHVCSAHGSVDARLIAVVEQRDVLCEAPQHLDLEDTQRRSRIGDDVLDAALVHGYHVGVALHHIDAVFLDDGFLRLVDAI